jgi:DNA-binding transcriptional LysR family regulator
LQIEIEAGSCQGLRDALRTDRVDLILVLDAPREESGLIFRSLVPEQICLVAYPWHPLASMAEVRPEHLQGVSLLHTEAECTYRVQFARQLAAAGVQPGTIMSFNAIEAIKQCVMAGLGIAVLPNITCANEFEQGSLVELPWAGPAIRVETQVGYHRDKYMAPAMAAFLDVLQKMLVN